MSGRPSAVEITTVRWRCPPPSTEPRARGIATRATMDVRFFFGGGVDFEDQLGESSAPTCNGEAFMRTPDSYDMI